MSFKERLEIEELELNQKIAKLSSFSNSSRFYELSEANRRLLIRQLEIMQEYSGILCVRLELLK